MAKCAENGFDDPILPLVPQNRAIPVIGISRAMRELCALPKEKTRKRDLKLPVLEGSLPSC